MTEIIMLMIKHSRQNCMHFQCGPQFFSFKFSNLRQMSTWNPAQICLDASWNQPYIYFLSVEYKSSHSGSTWWLVCSAVTPTQEAHQDNCSSNNIMIFIFLPTFWANIYTWDCDVHLLSLRGQLTKTGCPTGHPTGCPSGHPNLSADKRKRFKWSHSLNHRVLLPRVQLFSTRRQHCCSTEVAGNRWYHTGKV